MQAYKCDRCGGLYAKKNRVRKKNTQRILKAIQKLMRR